MVRTDLSEERVNGGSGDHRQGVNGVKAQVRNTEVTKCTPSEMLSTSAHHITSIPPTRTLGTPFPPESSPSRPSRGHSGGGRHPRHEVVSESEYLRHVPGSPGSRDAGHDTGIWIPRPGFLIQKFVSRRGILDPRCGYNGRHAARSSTGPASRERMNAAAGCGLLRAKAQCSDRMRGRESQHFHRPNEQTRSC